MKYKTYDKWKEKGFQVQRGEKAVKRNKHGGAVFAKSQTMPCDYSPQPFSGGNSHYAEDYSELDLAWDEDFRLAHGGFN